MQRFSVLILLALCTSLKAHPFHGSIAEAEWNPKTKMLEVALWTHPDDLEKALRAMEKKQIHLDKTKNVDQLIQNYLKKVIVIKDMGKELPMKWVGKEISVKAAWLYFEVPMKNGPQGVSITHRLFFELLDDQVNTINFKIRGTKQRQTLNFIQSRPTLTFSWRKKEK